MLGTIKGVADSIARQHLQAGGGQSQNVQTGGRSFQSVLEEVGQSRAEGAGASSTAAPPQAADAPQAPKRTERLGADVLRDLTKIVLNEESAARRGGILQIFSRAEKLSFRSDAMFRELSKNPDLSQGDLLVMQASVYKDAQATEIVSKVVDQVTGSIKTILNTSV